MYIRRKIGKRLSLCLNFFSPTSPKAKFRKKNQFIQTNSFRIFICPIPVLLVWFLASGLARRLGSVSLAFIPVFKPYKFKLYILRQHTN